MKTNNNCLPKNLVSLLRVTGRAIIVTKLGGKTRERMMHSILLVKQTRTQSIVNRCANRLLWLQDKWLLTKHLSK